MIIYCKRDRGAILRVFSVWLIRFTDEKDNVAEEGASRFSGLRAYGSSAVIKQFDGVLSDNTVLIYSTSLLYCIDDRFSTGFFIFRYFLKGNDIYEKV